jgi:hypothetical protein
MTGFLVCQHVADRTEKPEFLLGNRGWTLAAFCYRCELAFHLHEHFPIAKIPVTAAQLIGIPNHVGEVDAPDRVYPNTLLGK